MAREVAISRQGTAALVEAMDVLARQTSQVHAFVAQDSHMDRYGAFGGLFLSHFRDTYARAHGDLAESLAGAAAVATRLEDALARARRDVLRADEAVRLSHRGLEAAVTCVVVGSAEEPPGPGWRDDVAASAFVVDAVREFHVRARGHYVPKHRIDPVRTSGSPVALVDALETVDRLTGHLDRLDDSIRGAAAVDDHLARSAS